MMKILHMLHTLDTKVTDIGVTVRNGRKWFDAQKGDIIDLCVCHGDDHSIEGHGKIEFAELYIFENIPARFLEYEHELASRCYSGLLDSMRRAYGEGFSEKSEVVVLGYLRID